MMALELPHLYNCLTQTLCLRTQLPPDLRCASTGNLSTPMRNTARKQRWFPGSRQAAAKGAQPKSHIAHSSPRSIASWRL